MRSIGANALDDRIHQRTLGLQWTMVSAASPNDERSDAAPAPDPRLHRSEEAVVAPWRFDDPVAQADGHGLQLRMHVQFHHQVLNVRPERVA